MMNAAAAWYCDEAGHIFVPAAGVAYLDARMVAKSNASLMIGDGPSGVRYEGRRDIVLTDHEIGCRCGADGCNLRTESCWVFMTEER
jgi:hypothetical protein